MDHRFIGPMDALTYLPGASAAISVYATLPDGVAGPEIQATCAVPAGQYVRFLDGIADGAGGVFLVGETCGSATAGCTLPCTTLVVQVSSSGGVTQ
jgi:hypothetical protein